MEPTRKPLRLFIAASLGERARAAAAAGIERLRSLDADVKWVLPENLHLTLRFLGWTAEDRLPAAKAALRGATRGRGAFDIAFDRLGFFGPASRPRVVWAGVGAGEEPLKDLAAAFEAELRGAGFPAEERPYAAHLTLGRVRSNRGAEELGRALRQEAPFSWVSRVDRALLVQTHLAPSGPTYDVLEAVPLSDAAA